ncbi:MAG: type VI secretion system ATPase TssH [Gammaproteobacteria bacterium HGW-Gammaproteobacteria-8]|nr:MAG: type VI secretion system ATPase TssH [Gammaproteobacteria bacterium HGW-Gammaproteobacteria-8]
MAEISRVALFNKLNPTCYKAIESATVFCKMRGNPYVELAHWVQQLLQLEDSDLRRIIDHFDINDSHLARDITQALDQLPRGASSISDLSSHVEEAVERAWVWASLLFNASKVRSGHLVLGILRTRSLAHALLQISDQFSRIKPEQLSDELAAIVSGSPEDHEAGVASGAEPGEASGARPSVPGKTEALAQFSIDLTEQARSGELDEIVGRDDEIRQIIDILMRRKQNNPILTGEAGVGKTAAVEGFALRVVRGEVPPMLANVEIRVLDVGLLQAGASMKGEFENRLKNVIEEVQSSERPTILFIDEAHTLIGAGGAAGTGDAANLLKPALARGHLRTIAATTWAEYKKHIEKDPALTRRFQVVKIAEPSIDKAVRMMRAIAPSMEKHHKVLILDEALEAAVKLSSRYLTDRQLPDKSVSLLDTACARVATALHAVPAELEDCRRNLQALEIEQRIIDRERDIGINVGGRGDAVAVQVEEQENRRAELEARWTAEKEIIQNILALREQLAPSRQESDDPSAAHLDEESDPETKKESVEPAPLGDSDARVEVGLAGGGAGEVSGPLPDDARRQTLWNELKQLNEQLETLQGDHPLLHPAVGEQSVAAVLADWTGIPVGRMVKDEIRAVLELEKTLGGRIIGQDHALGMIARRIETARARLDNPSKPIGVFMLAGPSGVGKTETALALAETLYGGERNLITINMSEYQEAHTVSSLKGAPPGYVGYGEGGVLTEAVRRKPYSVILLDEVEKAHPDVHEIFFQVFDKGMMEDGEGRLIDFKNTVILLTSNVGSDLIMNMCQDPDLKPEADGLAAALREPLLKTFPAALLGRLVVIPYYPLDDAILREITRLQLKRIEQRVVENYGIPFTYSDAVPELVIGRCKEVESGGRMIDSILTNSMLPEISRELLNRKLGGADAELIKVDVADERFTYHFEAE